MTQNKSVLCALKKGLSWALGSVHSFSGRTDSGQVGQAVALAEKSGLPGTLSGQWGDSGTLAEGGSGPGWAHQGGAK